MSELTYPTVFVHTDFATYSRNGYLGGNLVHPSLFRLLSGGNDQPGWSARNSQGSATKKQQQ